MNRNASSTMACVTKASSLSSESNAVLLFLQKRTLVVLHIVPSSNIVSNPDRRKV